MSNAMFDFVNNIDRHTRCGAGMYGSGTSMRNYSNIDRYLDLLSGDVYPEPECEHHDQVTEKVFELFINPNVALFSCALDVGCGQGVSLKRFRELGVSVVGITLSQEDYATCVEQGFDVKMMDQSFLDFSNEHFDLIYARHVLEHSPFPLLTLFEFNRVLKKDGLLYVEVPWAESVHSTNQNHYSTLGKMSWIHLFKRSGFSVLKDININFSLKDGRPDEYWGWWLMKLENLPAK